MASSAERPIPGEPRRPVAGEEAGPVTPTSTDSLETVSVRVTSAVAGFAFLAAVVSAVRAVRTGLDGGSTGVALAAVASLLALLGAAAAFRSLRLAALVIAVALLLELLILDRYGNVAPPRLINAIPLLFALALALVSGLSRTERSAVGGSRLQKIATIVALALMVPIGFTYFVTGLVAPTPDVYGAYTIFALLLGGAVWLARRRSWWVVAVPIVSAGIWPLMVWAGETYLNWSP